MSLSAVHTWYLDDASDLREIETSRAGTGDNFVIRSGSPAGDWSRVIVKVPGTRKCDGTGDVPSNLMKVAKGVSSEVCGVLSALDSFLSIAPPAAGRRSYDDRFLPRLYPMIASWS